MADSGGAPPEQGRTLSLDGCLPDLKVVVGGGDPRPAGGGGGGAIELMCFSIHRVVLEVASTEWGDLLKGTEVGGEFRLRNTKPATFARYLSYCYTGKVPRSTELSAEMYMELGAFAHAFRSERLRQYCAAMVQPRITVDNVPALLLLHQKLKEPSHTKILLRFVAWHTDAVARSKNWGRTWAITGKLGVVVRRLGGLAGAGAHRRRKGLLTSRCSATGGDSGPVGGSRRPEQPRARASSPYSRGVPRPSRSQHSRLAPADSTAGGGDDVVYPAIPELNEGSVLIAPTVPVPVPSGRPDRSRHLKRVTAAVGAFLDRKLSSSTTGAGATQVELDRASHFAIAA